MPSSGADALLFDLGRVVIDVDFNRAFSRWAEHARCDQKLISERFRHDTAYERHERGEGAFMNIVVWLRSLGLGKYEAAFRENEIDETVLPSLTEEHLKQLGVTALGHRVKLLDAIAALRNDTSGKAPSVDAATTSSAPSAPPEDRAERHQVTVCSQT